MTLFISPCLLQAENSVGGPENINWNADSVKVAIVQCATAAGLITPGNSGGQIATMISGLGVSKADLLSDFIGCAEMI